MHAGRSLECGVVLAEAVAGEALGVAAAYLARELLERPVPTVSLVCAARYAAWRVLAQLPREWTVGQALVALEQAPYHVPDGGHA